MDRIGAVFFRNQDFTKSFYRRTRLVVKDVSNILRFLNFGLLLNLYIVVVNDLRGDQDNKFGLHNGADGSAKKSTENRDIPEQGDLLAQFGFRILDQTADENRLTAFHQQ